MNTHATPTCTSHQIYHPYASRVASYCVRLAAVLILFLIASCTPAPVAVPTASATAEPALPTSTPTPEPTPTPIVEPSPITSAVDDLLPVTPPNFDTYVNLDHGSFDLVDAHAVYALYRQQVGMRGDDADFLSAMETYAGELGNQGIELKQATVEGQTYSLLTKGTQILLNFNADGALKDSDPGYWSSDSTSEWIDAGGPVELFVGDDGHAYIGKLDAEGNVIAFLNTIGATLDNLDQQWVEVKNGQSLKVWDAKRGWIKNPMATIPPEWQGKIDHIETLSDGRTVAIASPKDPQAEPLLRVMQLTDQGEWITYVPEIGINKMLIGNNPDDDSAEWLRTLTLPELTTPIIDAQGEKLPLGYLGSVPVNDSLTAYVFSGIFGGSRYVEGHDLVEHAVFVPTTTGDYQLFATVLVNVPIAQSFYNIGLGRALDSQALQRGEYDAGRLFSTESSFVIHDKITKETDLAQYMLHHYPVGTQYGLVLFDHVTFAEVDYAEQIMDFRAIIEGQKSPQNGLLIPVAPMIIIPEFAEAMFDN